MNHSLKLILVQALPDAVPSAYGSWSSSASKEMQLGAIPSFIQPFQDAGKGGDQISDRNTRWAYSVSLTLLSMAS